jgi:hypothetical protein
MPGTCPAFCVLAARPICAVFTETERRGPPFFQLVRRSF